MSKVVRLGVPWHGPLPPPKVTPPAPGQGCVAPLEDPWQFEISEIYERAARRIMAEEYVERVLLGRATMTDLAEYAEELKDTPAGRALAEYQRRQAAAGEAGDANREGETNERGPGPGGVKIPAESRGPADGGRPVGRRRSGGCSTGTDVSAMILLGLRRRRWGLA